jgi:hypothetical protein
MLAKRSVPVPALFDASLSGHRGGGGDALLPVRCRPPFGDLIFCEPGNLGRHLNYGALVVSRRDPLLDSVDGTARVLQAQARLIEDEASQRRQISGSTESAACAPGTAEQHHRLPSLRRDCIHDRRNVAELALGGVIRVVPTGAEATAVHGEDCELVSQLAHQRREHRVVAHRAVHQYQGRPLPVDPDGDRTTVARLNL